MKDDDPLAHLLVLLRAYQSKTYDDANLTNLLASSDAIKKLFPENSTLGPLAQFTLKNSDNAQLTSAQDIHLPKIYKNRDVAQKDILKFSQGQLATIEHAKYVLKKMDQANKQGVIREGQTYPDIGPFRSCVYNPDKKMLGIMCPSNSTDLQDHKAYKCQPSSIFCLLDDPEARDAKEFVDTHLHNPSDQSARDTTKVTESRQVRDAQFTSGFIEQLKKQKEKALIFAIQQEIATTIEQARFRQLQRKQKLELQLKQAQSQAQVQKQLFSSIKDSTRALQANSNLLEQHIRLANESFTTLVPRTD